MNHKIKIEIDNIPIPPELHERSKIGIAQAKSSSTAEYQPARRPSHLKIIAVSILGIALLSSILFHPQVIAAFQKALQFMPGIGVVMEEDTPQSRYILQEPINVQMGSGTLKITGIVVEQHMTYMTMTGTNIRRLESIKLVNPDGKEYKLRSAQSVQTSGMWSGSFWYEGKVDVGEHAELIIEDHPEVVVAVTLTEAKTFDDYQDMGETAKVEDVAITAIADRVGQLARVTLVSRHPKDLRIADYGLHGVHEDRRISIHDEHGQTYTFERDMGLSSPAREFYFEISDSGDINYTITIPEINVVYDDQADLTLVIPEVATDVNQTFELAGFPVKITKLERIDRHILRVYVDLQYDEQSSKSLHNFRIDGISHSARVNEQTMAMEYMEFEIDPDQDRVKVTFTAPEVLIRGPWEFELPAETYFQ